LASLVVGSFPFSNFFWRRLSSSSSSLRLCFDSGGLLDAISSFSWWLKICSVGSPPALGDWRFVVLDREEEEEVKKMISLWKK
jgi:hypothetical protein